MKNAWKSKFLILTILLVTSFLLTGASGCPNQNTAKEEPQVNQGQVSDAGQQQQQVDRKSILKEEAAAFFKNLPQDVHLVTATELKDQLESNAGFIQVVDIRTPEDFAKAHIEGAINIPFGKVGDNMDQLSQSKQIVVSCYTGQTAGMTIAALNIAGYKAKSLRGGFPSWENADFPTVSGEGEQGGTD